MQVPIDYFLKQLATGAVGTALDGVLKNAKLGLFTNAVNLTQQTLLADLVEPTYTGYARQIVTWEPIYQQPDGSWTNQGGALFWQMGDDLTPTVVLGLFLVDSGGTHLLLAENLADPINLVSSANAFLASPQVTYGTTGWGSNGIII
jgi:hypothetical protein